MTGFRLSTFDFRLTRCTAADTAVTAAVSRAPGLPENTSLPFRGGPGRGLLIAFLALTLTACNFLEEDPRSGQPEEAIITSAATLERQALLTLYDHIGSNVDGDGLQGTYRGVYDLQTFASNEALIPIRGGDWLDGGLWRDLHEHTWTPDNECFENAWRYLYQLVGLCNHSLALLQEYNHLLTPDQSTSDSAEVRAVRAMAYMYLMDLFGRVPVVTKADTHVDQITQSERSRVFDFIWQELLFAEAHLKDERSNNRGTYYGRITQPVARFMLMKLALNAPVWLDDDWTDDLHPDEQLIMDYMDKVCYYGQRIIDSQARYDLCPTITDCFKVYNEEAVENIFTIPMDPNIYRNRFKNLFRSLHYQHASALGYGGENGSCATLETLNVFGYGTQHTDCRFAVNFFAGLVLVNGIPLLLSSGEQLRYYPWEVKMNLTGSPYVATAGARMKKYAYDPSGIFDGQLRNSDIVLFRFADVCLMMAEALVRKGESGQAFFDLVRNREPIALNQPTTPRMATLDNIYYERWMELMWEGWHRQDQIRFETFENDPHFRYRSVFPIPQQALQTNPNLSQNKGY